MASVRKEFSHETVKNKLSSSSSVAPPPPSSMFGVDPPYRSYVDVARLPPPPHGSSKGTANPFWSSQVHFSRNGRFRRCFRCGGLNHIAKDYRESTYCFNCGLFDHKMVSSNLVSKSSEFGTSSRQAHRSKPSGREKTLPFPI